ncbi:Imm26 family immunity protein [Pseudomonas protegens]|uniref:Imm26 family immunity protein n=1 Tax=Pseudomonas protegens TaxID=380021 RepID=UPI0009BC3146
MLRFIKAGDIFFFQISDNKFEVGRFISKVSIGHSTEIFDHFSSDQNISEKSITSSNKPLFHLILDSYSLFDNKISGDWRTIDHQDDDFIR